MDRKETKRAMIVTVGTRGDIQPYIALCLRLKEKGWRIAIATHKSFLDFVRTYLTEEDAQFCPLEGDPHAILQSPDLIHALHHEGTMKQGKVLMKYSDYVEQNWPLVWKYAMDFKPSMMIATIVTIMECVAVVHKLQIPMVIVSTIPFFPTGEFPLVTISAEPFRLTSMNRMTYWAGMKALWMVQGGKFNKFRESVGLPTLSEHNVNVCPYLNAFSSLLQPSPSDWPDHVHTTGFWTLPQRVEYKPTYALQKFLSDGIAPVYMGFGSMPVESPLRLISAFSQALTKLNMRGIFCAGWGWSKLLTAREEDSAQRKATARLLEEQKLAEERANVSADTSASGISQSAVTAAIKTESSSADSARDDDTCFLFADHVLAVKEVPHEWLLPRCSISIHHGGAGTTAAGARAGVPQIIFPMLGDQPFWAFVLGNKANVAPKTWFPLRELTEETVKTQIKAVDNEHTRNIAFALGEKIRAEDGLSVSVELIEKYHSKYGNCGIEQNWVPDAKARSCLDCEEPFTLTFRRHHCRSCGNVYCYKCMSKRPLIGFPQDQPQYMCTKCITARETYNIKIPSSLLSPAAPLIALPVAEPVVKDEQSLTDTDSL